MVHDESVPHRYQRSRGAGSDDRVASSDAISLFDLVGLVVFAVGFVFEAVGDWQLSRFKADPANAGKVLDTGLQSLTRHPNYLGNALMWWGFWLCALDHPFGWATAFGPALMTYLLLKVSGVSMLEEHLETTKPGYEEYVRNTPAFLPRPPKRSR